MRPENFSVEQLISELQGTCKTIQEFLPEGMEEDDLTEEDLQEIDNEVFLCSVCGWWYEICEESGSDESELICNDCSEE